MKLLEERIAIKSVAAAAADLKSACGIDGRRSANSGPAGIGLAAPLGLAAPPASLGHCGGPCCVLWAVANVDGLLPWSLKLNPNTYLPWCLCLGSATSVACLYFSVTPSRRVASTLEICTTSRNHGRGNARSHGAHLHRPVSLRAFYGAPANGHGKRRRGHPGTCSEH